MIDSRNRPPDFGSFVVNFRDVNRTIVLFPFFIVLKGSRCLQVMAIARVLVLVATGYMPALFLLLPTNADPVLFNCDSA